MNALAAMALAAGELVCDFEHGSLMLYAIRSAESGVVLQSRRAGRYEVTLRAETGRLHLVEDDGASLRVTTLTACSRRKGGACTRFEARHAWHFDSRVRLHPEASFQRQPSGGVQGRCEPWKMD